MWNVLTSVVDAIRQSVLLALVLRVPERAFTVLSVDPVPKKPKNVAAQVTYGSRDKDED